MHRIEILNLNSQPKVSQTFVLIKGLVLNTENSTCCNVPEIVVCKRNELYEKTQLKGCTFKFLVELKLGLNILEINCCCATLPLNIEYQERETDFTILPVYIICEGHNGNFQAPSTENNTIESACKRILIGAKLLQCLIAEKLFEQNLGRKTFKLENGCSVFNSNLPVIEARKMNQKDLWIYFARELLNSHLAKDNRKILAFLSCTKYEAAVKEETYENILKQTQAHAALGGGGLALFGTACLYTWPEEVNEIIPRFLNEEEVDKRYFMDDSCYRGTLGSCFSTTLGSVLHELCHTFDLGHTDNGIMGRGFDNIYKVFTTNETADCTLNKHTTERKRRDDDGIYWTKGGAVLLSYHKWINGYVGKKAVLQYDSITRAIKSTAGIRVIEVRSESDEIVLYDWTFTSKVLKFSFVIPDECWDKLEDQQVLIVIEDNCGNILKETFTVKTKRERL